MLLLRCTILFACLLAIPAARAQQQTLNIYGWANYIDPVVLDRFTSETGIKIRYDTYSDLGMLEATLGFGHSGYDIVMPTNEPTLSRLIRRGWLQPIDRTRVPNWRNLDPVLMQRLEISDPGNKYGAIFLWGTLGLGILPNKVRELAPDAPLDSFDLLFKPENAMRLEACGITMLDAPVAVIPPLLHYLGLPTNSTDPRDLATVAEMLARIRPYIHTFTTTSALETLADGSTCVALAYSGNVMQAEQRANPGVTVRYVLPKEGAQLTFDVLSIPLNAPHPDAALAFIDFMLRPDIIAHVTNVTRYANAVPASHPMIDPALLADPNIFPSEERMKTFVTPGPILLRERMRRNHMWIQFKEVD